MIQNIITPTTSFVLSYCPSLHISYSISLPEVLRLWYPVQTPWLQELPASPFRLSRPQAAASCSFSFATLWGYAAKWVSKLRHNKNVPAALFYFWGEVVPQAVVSAVILAYCVAEHCNFPLTHTQFIPVHISLTAPFPLCQCAQLCLGMGIRDLTKL